MASIESRMTGTRKAFCPPAPIAAWKWHVSAPCSSQVMPMPLEERLDRAVDLMLVMAVEDTRLILRMIGLGQHHGGLRRQHELAIVMLGEVE